MMFEYMVGFNAFVDLMKEHEQAAGRRAPTGRKKRQEGAGLRASESSSAHSGPQRWWSRLRWKARSKRDPLSA
jgi:hypothetical protein